MGWGTAGGRRLRDAGGWSARCEARGAEALGRSVRERPAPFSRARGRRPCDAPARGPLRHTANGEGPTSCATPSSRGYC